MSDYSLARLLDPITTEVFFAEYYESKLLHIARGDPDFYPPLMSLADVETYLATQQDSQQDRIRFVPSPQSGDKKRRASRKSTPLRKLYAAFNAGETLVFEQAEIGWPPFAKLTASLGCELSADVHGNVYATPPGPVQGFEVHQDLHDTVILQLDGTKEWEFYEPWFELPIGQRHLPEVYDHIDRYLTPEDFGDPTRTLTLSRGDLLYIPRGLPHCARTTQEASLHATVGLFPTYWTDLVAYALGKMTLRDPRFRRALPPGYFGRNELHPEMEKTFRQLLVSLAESAELEDALVEAEAYHLGSRAILPSGHFRRLAESKQLRGESVVAVRDALVCRVLLDDEHAFIYFADNHIRAPRWVEPALRYIEGNRGEFCVSDLPKPLSANSKLILARRLVREGLLTIRSL